MALGHKLIDSALRKAIYPTVLIITSMPKKSNSCNASYNHKQRSAILKYKRCFVPSHVVLPRDSIAREVLARAKSSSAAEKMLFTQYDL